MAFDFGSDILVDAMRAADPQQAAQARSKLQELANSRGVPVPTQESFGAQVAQGLKRNATAESPKETLQKFEAVVLSTFVQAMMPKDATSVFGEGLSGDMWKAQMAEKMGEQLAKNGGIGIADRLLKSYTMENDQVEPVSGLQDPSQVVAQNHGSDGAGQLINQIERSVLLSNGEGREDASVVLGSAAVKNS